MLRRAAAAGTDAFLAYAVASLVIVLGSAGGVRLALEPVLVLVLAAYAVVSLARTGRTVGKQMLGLEVRRVDGTPLGWPGATRRELAGKWGPGVVAACCWGA